MLPGSSPALPRGVERLDKRPNQRFRALRHPITELSIGPIFATAWHERLQMISAVCENLSQHGMLLRIAGGTRGPSGAWALAIEDTLRGLHVTLEGGEVICHGEGVVRHLRPYGEDLLCGVHLQVGAVDLSLLHAGQTRAMFSARCEEALRIAEGQRICPEFRAWVSDLRLYLESVKTFLDHEESQLGHEDRFTREQICAQYLAEIGPKVVRRVHAASHRLGPMLHHLSDEEHAYHRAFGQQHLGSLFATSPFMRRALEKPLGYAGDYELMNMLYRPPEEGTSLFGQVMNLCWVREVAARANINRVSYLADKIRTVVRDRLQCGQRAMIASIGSGPARELEMLLDQDPALGQAMDVVLVDQDARAINFCERRLSAKVAATSARVHYVRESIRRLLTGGSLGSTLGPRDLIYSAGLFDYLSERSFAALLSGLYDATRKGGTLLIGNVDVSNPTRFLMEYFGEWYLIHRSADKLLEHGRHLRPLPSRIWVESEPLGVNLFLAIEK